MAIRNGDRLRIAGVGCAGLLALCVTVPLQGGESAPDIELGRRIFEHDWTKPDELSKTLGEGGDGLGPVFNDVSCVACHGEGGTGGAGSNERNAILLSIADETPWRWNRSSLAGRAARVHFGFSDSTSVFLHKFGPGSDGAAGAFAEWRAKLLSPVKDDIALGDVLPIQFDANRIRFELAQRNPPALWGLGIIDVSAAFDTPAPTKCSAFRAALRDRQEQQSPWITGRIPRTRNGEEGWFGWRGQSATLEEFVRSACANQLGLEVPGWSQPVDPSLAPRERIRQARECGFDLTEGQCLSLASFVENLPRPQLIMPESPDEQESARNGEEVFQRAGCADCHVPDFAGIVGLYSDMLLHDMGDALADHASAIPDDPKYPVTFGASVPTLLPGGSSGAYECECEWKTPPLWGVADSAPYLHDGRAATLLEAIRLHAGEAEPSRDQFLNLPEDDQADLLAFLHALRAPRPEGPRGDVELGKRIFEHNWAKPDELDKTLGTGGDGLGPLFNDVSCIACHGEGGAGGGGPNDRNATLLSIVEKFPVTANDHFALVNRAKEVHFGFADSTSVVLHNFGIGPDSAPYEFDEWRANLLSPADEDIQSAGVVPVQFSTDGVRFELAQRNTSPLWGLGLISSSATGSQTRGSIYREELRDRQKLQTPWITGRIPRTSTGAEGWFGWRGQIDTLDDFVRSACASELGLQVPGHSQALAPNLSPQERSIEARNSRLDLTDDQCRSLTAFVESLPRPQLALPETPRDRSRILDGEREFGRAGCADCHVPDFAEVTGLYSDMLLHDMGESLSDRAGATPDPQSTPYSQSGGSYYGGNSTSLLPDNSQYEREWKTPPLWGVADSAPYLHDGRAATLEEAIRLHGGEAEKSRNAFLRMSKARQSELVAFLQALRAPLVK